MRFVLADGVELHVRAGAASFQPSQLVRLVEAARLTLGLRPPLIPLEGVRAMNETLHSCLVTSSQVSIPLQAYALRRASRAWAPR